MNVRPLHDYVIVRRKEEEHLSSGGHRYTGYGDRKTGPGGGCRGWERQDPQGGNVVPLDTKPGDQVLFGKYAGTEIKLEGEEMLVMREADIMAVLEE